MGAAHLTLRKVPMRSTLLACVAAASVAFVAAGCSSSTGSTSDAASSGTCPVKPPNDLVNQGRLTFGTSLTLAPQDYQENGKPTGSDIEIAQAIAKQMCLTPDFVNYDFQGILPAINAKKVDAGIATFGITPERQKAFDFVPYFIGGQAMLANKSSNLKVDGIEAVCGHTFAVMSGSVELANLQKAAPKCPGGKKLNYSVYPSMPEIVQQLLKGTQQLAYVDWTAAAYAVKQQPEQLALASSIFSGRGASTPPNIEGIAVRKGDTETSKALSQALNAVVNDGTYTKILKKYGLDRGDVRHRVKLEQG